MMVGRTKEPERKSHMAVVTTAAVVTAFCGYLTGFSHSPAVSLLFVGSTQVLVASTILIIYFFSANPHSLVRPQTTITYYFLFRPASGPARPDPTQPVPFRSVPARSVKPESLLVSLRLGFDDALSLAPPLSSPVRDRQFPSSPVQAVQSSPVQSSPSPVQSRFQPSPGSSRHCRCRIAPY